MELYSTRAHVLDSLGKTLAPVGHLGSKGCRMTGSAGWRNFRYQTSLRSLMDRHRDGTGSQKWGALWIHIQQHGRERLNRRRVEPIRQCANGSRIAERKNKQLIWIDDQGPMPMAVSHQQPVHPIDAKAGPLIALSCRPKRNVRLIREILSPTIIAIVVDHQKVVNAEVAIILKEIRQPHVFVAQCRDKQNIAFANLRGAICNRRKLVTLTQRTNEPATTLNS